MRPRSPAGRPPRTLRHVWPPSTRLVQAALGPAVNQRPRVPPPLVGHGEHHVGIVRVDGHIADAGVLADLQHLAPGRPAVGGLVQAALASGRPQGAVGCDEDHLRVARIDDDAPNLLRSLQPEIPPRPAGIVTAVHAVAVPDAALVVGFARAHPDRAGVAGVDGDGPDRVGALVLEDGCPRDAGVGRLPHAARRHPDVPGLLVVGMHGDGADAARHQRRPDRAKPEVGERACRPRVLGTGASGILRARFLRVQAHRRNEGGNGKHQFLHEVLCGLRATGYGLRATGYGRIRDGSRRGVRPRTPRILRAGTRAVSARTRRDVRDRPRDPIRGWASSGSWGRCRTSSAAPAAASRDPLRRA